MPNPHVSFGGIYFKIQGLWRLMMGMDREKPRPHRWKGLGGRGEPAGVRQSCEETPEDTARHELREEAGIEVVCLGEANRPMHLLGRTGPHDFVPLLLKPTTNNEDDIVPGDEIMVIGLLTDDQVRIFRKFILPNHYNGYVKFREDYRFLFEEGVEFVNEEDVSLESEKRLVHLIYESEVPGLDPSAFHDFERVYSVEKPPFDRSIKPRTIWHAHVDLDHGQEILNFLEARDEEITRAARTAKRFEELRNRPSLESTLSEVRRFDKTRRHRRR
ncbi:MAG: NUDIX domain-containing protein [Patescibacteria group bacterium]